MSHFNAVAWRAQRSPACSDLVAQLARPAGVVTWQAHEQQGESRRIEACQPEVMCQLKMRGFKRNVSSPPCSGSPMSQHFLLSSAARTFSLMRLCQLSDEDAY